MDIGIISDIHGDYRALDRALEFLDNYHKVDHILCAGDLIGRGPEQDRVVETIRQRKIPTVRGNHDEWVHSLSPDNTVFLKQLPMDWYGNLGAYSVFMCHGKPGNNLWGLYRDHLSDTLLNMMLSSLKADILVTGHTHVPLHVKVDQGCVVNPGSIYTFNSVRKTSHTYGVLHMPEMIFNVYDVTKETPEAIPIGGV